MIGLGKMGAPMARRLRAAGHEVVGYSRHGDGAPSLEAAVAALRPPRLVWLMIPAPAVAETARRLGPLLAAGDVVVDGGNSRWSDAAAHAALVSPAALLDAGVSGGVHGEKEGYCLMVGGPEAAVEAARPALEALGPWRRVGELGWGHYAKMVHNAIEYGVMQAYAEGFALLDQKGGYDLEAVARLWTRGTIIRSFLLELTADALKAGVRELEPWVDDSGEGRWALREAADAGVPTPALAAALFARFSSRGGDDLALRLLAAMRRQFGGHAVKTR